ncbi:sterol 24-C-methyltransferase [Cenococcum geophilum]
MPINKSSKISYYNSFKSQIGYRLILGRIRYYSYYLVETKWLFLITRALRAIEDHLFNSLNPSTRAIVLDMGCGVGYIVIYMVKKGLRIFRIDVVNYYLTKANKNIKAENLKQQFYRVLKLGGSVTLYKYNYIKFSTLDKINTFISMLANKEFKEGDIGFKKVKVEDLLHNIKPILRLFFTITYLPFLLIWLFSLKK